MVLTEEQLACEVEQALCDHQGAHEPPNEAGVVFCSCGVNMTLATNLEGIRRHMEQMKAGFNNHTHRTPPLSAQPI